MQLACPLSSPAWPLAWLQPPGPFTSKDDNRPILQCVNFEGREGKLYLVGADGFTLAVAALDYEDGEGKALINRNDLKGLNAPKRARRIRLGFQPNGSLDTKALALETDLIEYHWTGVPGSFPDYERLIPTDFQTTARFDTTEAIKAIASLKAIAGKGYGVDLTLDSGFICMDIAEEVHTAIPAEIEGNPIKVRFSGNYLVQALKACGGMVELKLANSYSPALFTVNGYQLVVMPMTTHESNEQAKRDKGEGEAEAEAQRQRQGKSLPERDVRATSAKVSRLILVGVGGFEPPAT